MNRRATDLPRQAQRLESIGRAACGVAHDINNLLTAILSCANEILEVGDGLGGIAAENAAEIRAAANAARELNRRLMNFARDQAIEPASLDLNDVLRGSGKLLQRVLGQNIELATRFEPTLWSVRCDRVQLEQVVFNLCLNARDAMPGGGTLTIETQNAMSCPRESSGGAGTARQRWVHLVVRDTGTGISEHVKQHLFEPFFTTKGPAQGMGLGLATVNDIVNQAGGHIHLESEPGKGTTFAICLPPIERRLSQAMQRPA